MRNTTITINFPALDRLIDYLQAPEQKEIDFLTGQVVALTETLARSRTKLDETIAAATKGE